VSTPCHDTKKQKGRSTHGWDCSTRYARWVLGVAAEGRRRGVSVDTAASDFSTSAVVAAAAAVPSAAIVVVLLLLLVRLRLRGLIKKTAIPVSVPRFARFWSTDQIKVGLVASEWRTKQKTAWNRV